MEKVNGLTSEQYEAAIKKYPILGKIYSLLRDFHRIVFSHQSSELDSWITKAEQLQIDEVNTYINGLKNDITAVKNGIDFKYNNGLAEGSVNKIKLTKRIMYGRNSFLLLKADRFPVHFPLHEKDPFHKILLSRTAFPSPYNTNPLFA